MGPRADARDVAHVPRGRGLRGFGRHEKWRRREVRRGDGRYAAASSISLANRGGARALYGDRRDSRGAREDGATAPARLWGEARARCRGGPAELGADQSSRTAGGGRGPGERRGKERGKSEEPAGRAGRALAPHAGRVGNVLA